VVVVVLVVVVVVVGLVVVVVPSGGLVPPTHSGTSVGASQFFVSGLKYKFPGHSWRKGIPLEHCQYKEQF
jgi:hypothetical protein